MPAYKNHHDPRSHYGGFLREALWLLERGFSPEEVCAALGSAAQEQGIDLGLIADVTDPMEAAFLLLRAQRAEREHILAELQERDLLVAGELPPRELEVLVRSGARVSQIHRPGPHGDRPPHFRHFADLGFHGFTNFEDVAVQRFSVVIVHGYRSGDNWIVSNLASTALASFRDAEGFVVPARHDHGFSDSVGADRLRVMRLV